MSTAYAANGNRPADQSLVVVRVEDAIDPRLAGRAGVVYESPPQSRAQAIALVQMLVAHGGEQVGNEAGRLGRRRCRRASDRHTVTGCVWMSGV